MPPEALCLGGPAPSPEGDDTFAVRWLLLGVSGRAVTQREDFWRKDETSFDCNFDSWQRKCCLG